MARHRISNKAKRRFKSTIKDVVSGLSKDVLVYKSSIKQECPNCYYDKVSEKSTGKCKWTLAEAEDLQADWELTNPGQLRYKWFRVGRCPVCRGNGYLEVLRRSWIRCLVNWETAGDNQFSFTPAGIEGASIARLKTNIKYYDLFREATKVVVDSIECKLAKPPVKRGLGNEDAVLLVYVFTDNSIGTSNPYDGVIKKYYN